MMWRGELCIGIVSQCSCQVVIEHGLLKILGSFLENKFACPLLFIETKLVHSKILFCDVDTREKNGDLYHLCPLYLLEETQICFFQGCPIF